jgi:hypothetical protein
MRDLIAKTVSIENSAVVCMARIRLADGNVATQSNVQAVTCSVYNLQTQSLVGSPTFTVAGTITNTLNTSDTRWTLAGGDSTGFNFSAIIDGQYLPDGNSDYQAEFNFVPTGGTNAVKALGRTPPTFRPHTVNIFSA